jgi:hypothetical protein
MFVADASLMLLLILLIGIAVGLLMYRYAGSRWITLANAVYHHKARLSDERTCWRCGFTGYHLATIAGAGGTGIALIAAAMGAALLVWAWRTIKF